MGIYKTYQEAVLANGSIKGVYVGKYKHLFYTNDSWRGIAVIFCDPADYLESVADFQARGKLLALGDDVVSVTGRVIRLDQCCEVWNSPSNTHDQRFVLQAAADNEDTDTLTWEPVFGDEVSTVEGVGMLLTTVVRDGTMSCIVQFENDWNEFKLDELKPVDHEYEAGKVLWHTWLDCVHEEINLNFDNMPASNQKAWIKFAKLVKPVDE